jgi:hypothetical protein
MLGVPDHEIEQPRHMRSDGYNLETYRAGIKRIDDISDVVYKFRTSLFKNVNNTRESLLQCCYAYRNFTFHGSGLSHIDCLLDIVANYDSNCAILRYLLTVAGPAYTCHRYWDWLEPFIANNLKNDTHNDDNKLRF